jgi:hypothetical protein
MRALDAAQRRGRITQRGGFAGECGDGIFMLSGRSINLSKEFKPENL